MEIQERKLHGTLLLTQKDLGREEKKMSCCGSNWQEENRATKKQKRLDLN